MKKLNFKWLNNYEKLTLFFHSLIFISIIILILKRLLNDYNIVEFNRIYNTMVHYLTILFNKIDIITIFSLIFLLYAAYVVYCTSVQLKNFDSIEIKYLNRFLYLYILLLLIYLILIANFQLLILTFLIHIPFGIFLSYRENQSFFLILIKYSVFIFFIQYLSYQPYFKNDLIYLLVILGSCLGYIFSKKYLDNSLKIKIGYTNELFIYNNLQVQNDYVNNVYFYAAIQLQNEFIKLKIIRLLRFLRRSFHNSTPILISIFCSVLFLLIIIPIGLNTEKYNSVVDGVWDMKSFFLTSIIITGITSITAAEKKHHEKLLSQRYIYSDFLEIANSCSKFLYSDILDIERLDDSYKMYSIPYGVDNKMEKIHASKNKNENLVLTIDNNDFKNIITDYINNLNEFKPLYNEKNIIGFSKYNYKYLIESIYILNKIRSINFNDVEAIFILTDNYHDLFWRLEYVAAEFRRPWTSDLSINKKINETILNGISKQS